MDGSFGRGGDIPAEVAFGSQDFFVHVSFGHSKAALKVGRVALPGGSRLVVFAAVSILLSASCVHGAGFTLNINFQRTNSANISSYLPDAGYVFGDRGNGFAYGWNVDNTANAFERNQYPDKKVDTGNKLHPSGESRFWEVAVPNGLYDVRLVAADPAVTNGNDGTRYSILAEGVPVITNDVPNPAWWVRGWTTHAQVRVADRRLTISNSPYATNNSIAFIEIKQLSPIYWGASVIDNTGTNKAPWDYTSENSPGVLGYFEAHTGKKISILGWGDSWSNSAGYKPLRWYTNGMNQMLNRGTIPFFTWGASGSGQPSTNFSMQNILAGMHDSYFSNWAAEARSYAKPFFLRMGAEMNGTWSPWCEGYGININCPPGSYTNTWRHVRDIFSRVGCTNVTWVWCVDRDITNQWHIGPVSRFYPGDAYVDWLAVDAYNSGGETFASVFGATYTNLVNLAPGKPIMIGETGTAVSGGPAPNNSKPAWISDALAQLPVLFPSIDAFVWFNWNSGSTNSNWPIEGGDNWLPYWLAPVDWASVNAFSNGIASPYYLPNVVTNLKASPIQPISLLNPPAALSASISNATVRLAWSAAVGATNFNLYRSTSGSKGSFIWQGRTAGTNWTDTTPIYGSSYYYVVAAENLAGESLDSAQVSAAIPRPGLTAQITFTNTLLLSWPASFTGFALESNSDLATNNWQNVTAPVNVASGYNRVTVSLAIGDQFYRLKLQ